MPPSDNHPTAKVILDAAQRVIRRSGVAKATLDEVAKEAAISKGGVLHHFPNKEAMLVAVLQDLISQFEDGIEAKRSADPVQKGAFTRALLGQMLDPAVTCPDIFLALKAAFIQNPALLELHRATSARWQERVEADGIDKTKASIVRFAAEGLGMARLYGVPAPSPDVKASVLEALLELTR